MKKIVFFIVFFTLFFSTDIFAQDLLEFDWQSDESGGVIITGYFGESKDVIIPSKIDNMPVTAIGDEAFYHNELTSVIISKSVITIGEAAFFANQMSNIVIPNSITYISDGAFENNNLSSVNFPNSVNSIGSWAFYNNPLTSITIGSNVRLRYPYSKDVFGNNSKFNEIYNGIEGTYTRPNTDSTL